LEELAYTCAVDLAGETDEALEIARNLLKDVRKSGLQSPFADALLRRLALAEWTRRDRPKPTRMDSRQARENAVLLFFHQSWDVSYTDLGAALALPEEQARHLVHKARLDHLSAVLRIPFPRPECRRPRELLSDLHQNLLHEPDHDEARNHLRGCRECSVLDRRLRDLLEQPPRPRVTPPLELVRTRQARPSLALTFEGARTRRRAGIALLAFGFTIALIQLHPGLNAYAGDQMERMGVSLSRIRTRGERLVEDLRVLWALAVGTVQGRTEELGQTLEEYVNSGTSVDSSNEKNKPESQAVLDSRTPEPSPSPGSGSPGPRNPEGDGGTGPRRK
jgi:hypothetical protein